MGKDLKGKELGIGICQEKSGLYLARYTDNFGKRHSKRFTKILECRDWIANATFNVKHGNIYDPEEMLVGAWFDIWFENKKNTTKPNTYKGYKRQYDNYIDPIIGDMKLVNVKPMHCQLILNQMAEKGIKSSSLGVTKTTLHNFFELAVANDIIKTNPCNKLVKANIGKASEERTAMTRDEQKAFVECIKGRRYELQYKFILQTGLRAGELGGLKWSDVDFVNRTIKVTENVYAEDGIIKAGTPKTKCSIRTIPLTDEAFIILKEQKRRRANYKVVPLQWKDYIFIGENDGVPIMYYRYDERLSAFCKECNLPRISMHILRHTFATRCIEAGMKPKTLQKILGHSNIYITMNRYVHLTEDEKKKEMDLIADALIV